MKTVYGSITEVIDELQRDAQKKEVTALDIVWLTKGSPQWVSLYQLVSAGKQITTMTINLEKTGGNAELYLTYFLSRVFRNINDLSLVELNLSKVSRDVFDVFKDILHELETQLTSGCKLNKLHLPPALSTPEALKDYPNVRKIIQSGEASLSIAQPEPLPAPPEDQPSRTEAPVIPTPAAAQVSASTLPMLPLAELPVLPVAEALPDASMSAERHSVSTSPFAPPAVPVNASTLPVLPLAEAQPDALMSAEREGVSASVASKSVDAEKEIEGKEDKPVVAKKESHARLLAPRVISGRFGDLINLNPADVDISQLDELNIILALSDSIISREYSGELICNFVTQFVQSPISTISFSQRISDAHFDLKDQQLLCIKTILAYIHLFKNLTVVDFSNIHPNIIFRLLKTINDELGVTEKGVKLCLPPGLLTAEILSPYPRLCRVVGVEIPGLLPAPILSNPSKFKGTVIEVIEALQRDRENKITELEIECIHQEKPFRLMGVLGNLVRQHGITKIAITDSYSVMDHFAGELRNISEFIMDLFWYPKLVELDLSKVDFNVLQHIFRNLEPLLKQTPSKLKIIVPKILIDDKAFGFYPNVFERVHIERSNASGPRPREIRHLESLASSNASGSLPPVVPAVAAQFGQPVSPPAAPRPYAPAEKTPASAVQRMPVGGRQPEQQQHLHEGASRPSDSINSRKFKPSPPPVLSLPEKIKRSLKGIDTFKCAFDRIPETSLKPYYDQVFNAFGKTLSDFAIEYNANCHDQEKLTALTAKIDLHLEHFEKFEKLLRRFFEIDVVVHNGTFSFSNIRLKPASAVKSKIVSDQANALISAVELKGFHGLAVSIANFITKTLLAIGIPVAATVGGAYVGGVVGGILGLSTVTFTGPAGLIVGASLGAWIGGAAGGTSGTAGGIYSSSKATFFSPVHTSLSAFARQSIDYANEADAVARLKAAPAA